MGLDAYFIEAESCEDLKEEGKHNEIAYFRKHSDLQGWMCELWESKGNNPDEEDFNCIPLELSVEDIDNLQAYAEGKDQKKHSGFFWGSSCQEDWEKTVSICPKLKNSINEGKKVFYYCWY